MVNVLIPPANGGIFYSVARRVLATAVDDGAQDARRQSAIRAGAAVAALVFGIHPLRVEPVSWITGRADLLFALFSLVAIWAYLRSVETDVPAKRGPAVVSPFSLPPPPPS